MYEIRKIERICLGGMILCGISTVWNLLKILWNFVFCQDSLNRQVRDFFYDSPSAFIGQIVLFILLFVFLLVFLLLRALRTDLNDLMDAIRRQGKEIDRIDAESAPQR